eukprot:53764_1
MVEFSIEAFQNTDWGNYAQKFGKIATVTALGMAVVEFLLLHWISATYSICLSLALSVIELPGVYNFIGACNNLTDILDHNLYFHKPIVRAIAYVILSIFLFWIKGFQIITGTLMLATASVYSFAAINGGQLDIDPGLPIPSVPGTDDSTAFGTFT